MKTKIKNILTFFVITFFIVNSLFSQSYNIDLVHNTTIPACKGKLFDSGNYDAFWGSCTGVDEYCNNEDYWVTIDAGVGKQARLNFLFINTELNFDFLRFYDGISTASPLMATISGYSNTGTSQPQSAYVATSTGRYLTVRFTSDGSNRGQNTTYYGGFYALMGCTPSNCNGNTMASDNCGLAPQICNVNGYCGNTGGWYTAGTEANPLSTDYGSIFCGTIENNSWISFEASGTFASFDITSSNCMSATSGIQSMIFDTPDCLSFTGVSNCVNQNTGPGTSTLSASGLVPGQIYYIMVDGYAGNNCDYTIVANTGVSVIDITSSLGPQVCPSQCTNLNVNNTFGATNYTWTSVPIGGPYVNDSNITVCPPVNTVYQVIVAGSCGISDTVTYTVNVGSPTIDFHGEINTSPYTTITPFPSTISCTDPWIYLSADDSANAGGYITPALHFEITTDQWSATDPTSVNIYAGSPPPTGTIIYSNPALNNNTILTVYGDHLSPVTQYYLELCDGLVGDGGSTYQVYDPNTGAVLGSGNMVSGNPCEVFGPFSPSGSATWTSSAPASSVGAFDYGTMYFDPCISGPGIYDFIYYWNDGVGCSDSVSHTITVTSPYNALWDTSNINCNSNNINLNTLILGTSGGTWFGVGVTDSIFIGGPSTILYSVGNDTCCSDTMSHIIVCPLPIKLISFYAEYVNKIVILNWTTISEINNDYFTIERSIDGITFKKIGNIKGSGNSIYEQYYSTIDNDPHLNKINYYRLKQVDFDGVYEYSNIISVNIKYPILKFKIYPNPSTEIVTIIFNSINKSQNNINIYDYTTKLVLSYDFESTKGENIIKLDLKNLTQGVYFINLKSNGIILRNKFIKE